MRKITRKGEVQVQWEACIQVYEPDDMGPFIKAVHQYILTHKVKFPLLEYCAREMYKLLPEGTHLLFCDAIEQLKTEGGNVILGIMLQLRLPQHFHQSLDKATEYISLADIWYVSDIIGERVFGYALLHYPEEMIVEYQSRSKHPSHWVVRALGAGGHYAIKKGLPHPYVKQLFAVLLTMANTDNKEIRQGVGWAAKTTAKFHPDIITHFATQIDDKRQVANWFRRKIDIGLNRNKYAQGN